MNIACDLDGCLYFWHRAVYTYCVTYRNETRSYFDFWRQYKSFPKEFWAITEQTDLYDKCIPTKDVLDTLNSLDSQGHTIYYITN